MIFVPENLSRRTEYNVTYSISSEGSTSQTKQHDNNNTLVKITDSSAEQSHHYVDNTVPSYTIRNTTTIQQEHESISKPGEIMTANHPHSSNQGIGKYPGEEDATKNTQDEEEDNDDAVTISNSAYYHDHKEESGEENNNMLMIASTNVSSGEIKVGSGGPLYAVKYSIPAQISNNGCEAGKTFSIRAQRCISTIQNTGGSIG